MSKKIVVGAIAGCAVILLAVFAGICFAIEQSVQEAGRSAQLEYGGDMVQALVHQALSEEASLAERDRAVWALGQLGDPAAAPALATLQDTEDCDHDRRICQHGIGKALAQCSEPGINIPAMLWRGFFEKSG